MSAVRAILGPHRTEAVGVAVFALLTFVVGGGLVVRLLAFGIPVVCFSGGPAAETLCAGRQPDVMAYLDAAGNWGVAALGTIVLLPAIGGLVFGIALVGKEIDQRTTTFAWSISPSRRRWLLQRVVPIAIVLVAASLAAGLLADELQALRAPGSDPSRTYEHLGVRGMVVGAEALAFFGLALLVGSVLGRILPALLMAGALAVAAFVGVTLFNDAFLAQETVLVYGVDGGVPGRVVDFLVQAPDGAVLTWFDAYARYGEALDQAGGPASSFRTVLRVNPPELYALVVARMSVLYSVIGITSITLAFAVVDRRRP